MDFSIIILPLVLIMGGVITSIILDFRNSNLFLVGNGLILYIAGVLSLMQYGIYFIFLAINSAIFDTIIGNTRIRRKRKRRFTKFEPSFFNDAEIEEQVTKDLEEVTKEVLKSKKEEIKEIKIKEISYLQQKDNWLSKGNWR